MSTVAQVDGLAGALLRCVDDPERIPLIQVLLDRYCHRLRNRLNSMKLSLYLARRLTGDQPSDDWKRADSAYRSIEAMIQQVQVFCNPLQTCPTDGDLNAWIEHRLPEWRRLLADRGMRLDAESPGEPLPGRFDSHHFAQALDGLITYWAEHGNTDETIRLSWGRAPDHFQIRFDGEDSLVRSNGDAESLALPVLARVLRAHQGRLSIPADASCIELSWPAECA